MTYVIEEVEDCHSSAMLNLFTNRCMTWNEESFEKLMPGREYGSSDGRKSNIRKQILLTSHLNIWMISKKEQAN